MDAELAKLISQSEFDSIMAPIESAMTPPDQAFNSQKWFDLEIERIGWRLCLTVS